MSTSNIALVQKLLKKQWPEVIFEGDHCIIGEKDIYLIDDKSIDFSKYIVNSDKKCCTICYGDKGVPPNLMPLVCPRLFSCSNYRCSCSMCLECFLKKGGEANMSSSELEFVVNNLDDISLIEYVGVSQFCSVLELIFQRNFFKCPECKEDLFY